MGSVSERERERGEGRMNSSCHPPRERSSEVQRDTMVGETHGHIYHGCAVRHVPDRDVPQLVVTRLWFLIKRGMVIFGLCPLTSFFMQEYPEGVRKRCSDVQYLSRLRYQPP